MGAMWKGEHSRRIVSRIVVEGVLVLKTPAHFGNGDTDEITDIPLMLDLFEEAEGRIVPVLTGASLAGALRNYLRERDSGYGRESGNESLCVKLFGGENGNDEGEQSPLIVEDARGENAAIEMRDMSAMNQESYTTDNGKKYDRQLWAAGTRFRLRFELVVREYDDETAMCQSLATALLGLMNGGITLGMRKTHGYGSVFIDGNWRVKKWNLTDPEELIDWLVNGAGQVSDGGPLEAVLGKPRETDKRDYFLLEATFSINGSLMIGSAGRSADPGPDKIHLKARQSNGRIASVISGDSLAGVLRSRARKIVATLGGKQAASAITDDIWGTDMQVLSDRRKNGDRTALPRASRLAVTEEVVSELRDQLVQSRGSRDRFTAGPYEAALFNEQPVFGDPESLLTLRFHLREPDEAEMGLLLLLLKDLWTGDLPVGGESSIGRGRLQGRSATLIRSGKIIGTVTATDEYSIEFDDKLVGMADGFVNNLKTRIEAVAGKEVSTS